MWLVLALLACRHEKVDSGAAPVDTDIDTGWHDPYYGSDECDDNDPSVGEDAAEECDGLDNNCDGRIDEGVTSTWYADADGDGYGDEAEAIESCEGTDGWIAVAGDCDDADPDVHPGAEEQCDGRDNSCEGSVDEGLSEITCYQDADLDGYGDPGSTLLACVCPDAYTDNGADCDDADPLAAPAFPEYCDGVDNDCDAEIDEDGPTIWYTDADGDGYGAPGSAISACTPGEGWVRNGDDCDDADATVNPGAEERRNDEVDSDCDGDTAT